MTSHRLNPSNKGQISCSASIILCQFVSLILIAAFFSPTLSLAGPPQRGRQNSHARQAAVLDHSTVGEGAGEFLEKMGQYQLRGHSTLLDPGAVTSSTALAPHNTSRFLEPALAEFIPCNLYPIALSSSSLTGVAPGGLIGDIYNGTQPGNFGWLTWTGSPSEPALVASLTPSGNSSSYTNPNNASDHEASVGDWVHGKPGISNSKSVRDALDALKALDIIVPVWNAAQGQGSNALYRVAAFAQVRLLAYQPGQSRISARFLSYTDCPIPVNKAPQVNAGPDQTITLPSSATLNGTVTDDGLPRGGTPTISWTKVRGPGNVTFNNASTVATTATFSMAGAYVLRLTASDSQLSGSDEVNVLVKPANQPPTVNAGADQTITLPNLAQLNGAATDDGLPADGSLTTLWSQVSGPGNVTFPTPASLATTASFSTPGTYVLRLTASDSQLTSKDDVTVTVNKGNQPPMVNAGPDQIVALPGIPPVPQTLALRALSSEFNSPIGIDYHQPTNKVVMSVNYPSGQPSNFELVAADGTRAPFANISGLTEELKLATARDSLVGGVSIGGFQSGELFTGSGVPGVIVRISPDGSTVHNPWVILPGESGLLRGSLHVDRTGVFGGDLIAVTTTGGVWRINAAGQPTQLTRLGTHLEGLSTIPNNPAKYGPWAGKILVGAEEQGFLYTVDVQGHIAFYQLGINPEDIDIIPANENFFGVGFSEQTLWGAPAAAFAGMVGDILVAQESPGILYRVRWNGSAFEKAQLAQVSQWEHVTFAPAGISEIPPVGVTVNLNGIVTDDNAQGFPLNVSWTKVSGPAPVSFANPNQTATNATFTERGTYVLRLTANDTEFIAIDEVTITVNPGNQAPAVNAGSDQTVTLPNTATLNGTVNDDGLPAGSVLVVSWSKVSGPGNVIFANAGAITTTASFSLPGVYTLRLTANDSQFSSSDDAIITVLAPPPPNQPPVVEAGPDQTVAFGDAATLSGTATDDGQPAGSMLSISWTKVSGPGSVTFGDATSLKTTMTFSVNGTYALRVTASDTQLSASDDVTINVVTNQPPNVDAGLRQTITLADVVNLNGTVSDDGIPAGGVLTVTWSKASGPGTVTFGNANAVDTNAAFSSIGYYVLRLTASDSILSSHSDVTIKVLNVDATPPGGVFVTGHDPDFHAVDNGPGTSPNPPRARHIIQRAVAYVTHNKANPRMLLVTDVRNPDPIDFIDSRLGLQAAGFSFDVADYGSGQQGALDLHTINLSNYDVIVVASDFGGWLRQDELDILNARRSEINNYVNSGGGLVALAESGSHGSSTTHDRFGFLPFLLSQVSLDHEEIGNTVTAAGLALGLTNDDVNGNAFHSFFTSTGGMDIIDLDPDNRILSLALRGKSVTTGGFANDAPIVSAGPDQTLTLPNNAVTLNGGVSDDGEPKGSPLTIQWSKVSGPGSVAFSSPNQAISNATFSANGTYVLRLTATDTQLSSSDEVIITVLPSNHSPTVNAGPDQTITLPANIVTLNGLVSDDGQPQGSTLIVQWSKVSGEGTVTFSSPQQAVTNATFGTAGTYVVRLTASDTELSSNDDVSITVNPSPAINQPPTVNAGPDQDVNLLGATSSKSSKGNIVVNHDEWTISDVGFASAPDATQFAQNLASLFTGGRPGKFLAYSSSFSVTDGQLVSTMTGAGHTWTTSTSVDFSLPNLLQYDAIFLAADPVDNVVLINYVKAGGNVYLALGTGVGGPPAEAARWNTFLNAFDLHARSEYNLISGVFPVTSQHPIFAGVRNLFYGNGQSVNRLSLADPHAAVLESGFFGIYQTNAQVQLNGIVTDDGLPAGSALAVSWNKVSGPGAVAFGHANVAVTTAAFGEPGSYVLRLTADDSQLSRSDDVVININSPQVINQPPTVDAGLEQTVTLPNSANLSGAASDDGLPQGTSSTFQWSKVSGPGSVNFSGQNQPTSNATFSVAGTYVLQLQASDTQFTSSDTVVINVLTDNQAPTVSAGSDQTIALGNTATLSGSATDDGRPAGSTLSVSWTKVSGPGTVTFGNASQSATTATFSAGGRYMLRLSANDSELTSSDDINVTVNQPPVVNAGPDQTITLPTAVTLNYTISDDGLPIGNTTVTWSKVSGPGNVSFENAGESTVTASFSEAGAYVLRLSADDSHLTTADEVTITVNAAGPPPLVSIISPADESTLTTRAEVIGSVSDGTWKLEYSLTEDEGAPTQWTAFATGSGSVSNATLGVFDPTLLLNGRYLIRLSATRGGQTGTALVGVVVSEEQKVGNFTVTFSDLSVPVAGLPIEVTRTYDSRDKRQGDFGVGWTLGIRDVRLQESRAAGAQWQGDVIGTNFPTYCINPSKPHVVTVTLSNGRVYKFEAVLSPGNGCQALAPLQEVTLGFKPLPGTNANLTPLGETTLLVAGPFPGAIQLLDSNTVTPMDYDQYQLTLEDGTVLLIEQRAGLQQMTDTNGNSLTINAGGIIHSSGKSITFTRDTLGRITQITDPAGNPMTYAYDANGDLVSFRDREGNITTFGYNTTHGLLTINDPRGIQPLRNEYDTEGRLIRQVDAFGKEINFTHDLNAQQETVFDRLGHPTVYDYDARGNVVRVQGADGKVTTRTYDPRDNLLSETNALGKTVAYTYDDQDNRLSETDSLNNVTSYTYNSRKQVLTTTDPANGVTTYSYDANGNQTAVKDALGHTSRATFSANGLQLTSTDALNNVTSFGCDISGNLISQTDPLGNVSIYTYDANGNRVSESETRTLSGATETLTTTFAYDKLGRQTKVTYSDGSLSETIFNNIGTQSVTIDQLGRRTSYGYDDMGQLIGTTYPDGTEEKSEYDSEGRRTKSIDRAGRATTYTYDSLGRLEKITFADGSTTINTYDALGQTTAMTDALNHVTQYQYDAVGRRTKVIDALNNETVFGYDTRGNQTSVKDAKGQITSYVYDANNRRTQVVFPDSTTQTTDYDDVGQVKVKTDQAGVQTRYDYDRRGRLIKVTDALGGVTSYTYDEQSNQLTQTDANNHTTAFGYDQMGRRMRRTLPLGMSETYAYDLAGILTSRTDFRGKTTTFAHDVMNRVLSKTPDPSLGETTVTFSYTATGQRQTMEDASGTTRYIYDPRDRLASKENPQGVLNYTYDSAGNLKSVRSLNVNGVTVDYNYDAVNRLASVVDNRLAGTTAYSYDPNGNLGTATYPNAVRTTYTYNNLNRLTNVNAAKGATLANYEYSLGAAGNRRFVTEASGRKVEYGYDALYRLKGEAITNDPAANTGAIKYIYDAVGNRLNRASNIASIPTTNSTYDENDRLTSDVYDPNGNTTASNGNTYQYDFENRLTSLNGGAVTFVYDGDGNRVAKTIGGVTTRYLVDTNNHTGHAQVVEEVVGSTVQRTYTYGHDLISQNQLIGGVGTPSFYGYDGHGSVRYLTNVAGSITDTYTYDAFGNLIARIGTTSNVYLYTGEQLDVNLGLYYLRGRYMNPSTGRFHTIDTFEGIEYDPRSLHLYLYAGGDPVNNVDPNGHLFSLVETEAANLIRNTLANIQMDIGNALADQARYGGHAGLKSLLRNGVWEFGKVVVVRVIGRIFRVVPRGALPLGTFDPGDLSTKEAKQLKEAWEMYGGNFKGHDVEGIDGWINETIPVSLTESGGGSLVGVLKRASVAEDRASNAGHTGVELFISAKNIKASELLKFAEDGGLSKIPHQGTIRAINVNTADGWVILPR